MDWHRSSYCNTDEGMCVEVSVTTGVSVRDGKLGAGSPVLEISGAQWTAFVDGLAEEVRC